MKKQLDGEVFAEARRLHAKAAQRMGELAETDLLVMHAELALRNVQAAREYARGRAIEATKDLRGHIESACELPKNARASFNADTGEVMIEGQP